jgi:ribosomal-protein-alanine N-acetyltransferase
MSALEIRSLEGPDRDHQLDACARLMSSTEPWITLRRTEPMARKSIDDPDQEAWIAFVDGRLAGFVLLVFKGVLRGYIRTICLAPEFRGRGFGTRLIAFAEERIFREHPNVFLCVSSFNPDARRLYERLGYRYVGELTDFIVAGHSELIYRKTRGPSVPA